MKNDPVVEMRILLPRAAYEAIFGPDPGERLGHWQACRENLRLARVAVSCATDRKATSTPAAHWAAAVRYLLQAQHHRDHAKRASAKETTLSLAGPRSSQVACPICGVSSGSRCVLRANAALKT